MVFVYTAMGVLCVEHANVLELCYIELLSGDHWRIQGGAPGTRAPPWGSKFFHFHAVFGKNVKNNSNFGSWRPPLGKILDPPLVTALPTPYSLGLRERAPLC